MPIRNNSNCQFEQIIAGLIRNKRIEAGFLQEDLAVKMGTNRKTLGDLEAGFIRVKIGQLQEVCQALGITVTSLVAEAEVYLMSDKPVPAVTRPLQGKVRNRTPKGLTLTLSGWLGGKVPTHLKKEHDASADELRRRDQERDSEDSPELCEADEG